MSGYSYVDEPSDKPSSGGYSFVDELPRQKKSVGLLDKVKAGSAGVNKGFYSDLLGLPVDTAANVLDLAKAGIGYGTSKITGKAPPAWTEPSNRESVFGSADWIAKNINKGSSALGMSSPIDNPNPQDAASRILHSGGRVTGASIVPSPAALISGKQQLTNAGMGALSGIMAGSTAEVAPEYAGVVGMLPQLAAASAVASTKGAVRGGEKGRMEMEQRLQDLKNAGIDAPSVGLASGNKMISGIENILAQTPFSSSLFEKSRNSMLSGMSNKTAALRKNISPEYGAVEAGSAIQKDLSQTGAFRKRVLGTEEKLLNKIQEYTGGDFVAPVDNSIRTAERLTTPIKGAENTLSPYMQDSIKSLAANLRADSARQPAKDWMGSLGNPEVPVAGMPFSGIRSIRSEVGANTYDPGIIGKKESGQYKTMYSALSQDLQNAANMADRQGISRLNYLRNKDSLTPTEVKDLSALEKMSKTADGRAQIESSTFGPLTPAQTPASTAYNRSNSFFKKAMDRAEDLNSLANRDTPEGAFNAVNKALETGSTTYSRLRGAVTPETRNKVAATIVDELGAARASNQNVNRDAWSPNTFFTNYNKLYGNGGGEALFKRLPGGKQHADNLADIAKAAEMVNSSSKVWSNPSGTAPALSARAAFSTVVGGVLLSPIVPGALTTAATAAGGLVTANATSRLLLNPKFASWLAKAPNVRPQETQAYVQRLIATTKMTGDKQFQEDVQQYVGALEQ